MKTFYLKLSLFASIMIGIILMSATGMFRFPIAKLTDSEEFITGNNGPDEIGPYIDKAREPNSFTKLILGDSVCHQMFTDLQNYNDDICILGSNAAITMAGQYILMHEFLGNHPDATDVWLIITPPSLSSFFDTYCGYGYVVMPNAEKQTLDILDKETIEQLESVYGKPFLNRQLVYFLDRSAPARKVYLNSLLKDGEGYGYSPMSPISVQYINKMQQLCRDHNVIFHFLPAPVREERRDLTQNVLVEFNDNRFNIPFPDFENSIDYYPDDQFRDGIHFGGEYANQKSYNEKIRKLADKKLLECLKFE